MSSKWFGALLVQLVCVGCCLFFLTVFLIAIFTFTKQKQKQPDTHPTIGTTFYPVPPNPQITTTEEYPEFPYPPPVPWPPGPWPGPRPTWPNPGSQTWSWPWDYTTKPPSVGPWPSHPTWPAPSNPWTHPIPLPPSPYPPPTYFPGPPGPYPSPAPYPTPGPHPPPGPNTPPGPYSPPTQFPSQSMSHATQDGTDNDGLNPADVVVPRPRKNRYLICEYNPSVVVKTRPAFTLDKLPLRICTHIAYSNFIYINSSTPIGFHPEEKLFHENNDIGFSRLLHKLEARYRHTHLLAAYLGSKQPKDGTSNTLLQNDESIKANADKIAKFVKDQGLKGMVLLFEQPDLLFNVTTEAASYTKADLFVSNLRQSWNDMFCVVGILPYDLNQGKTYHTPGKIISTKSYLMILGYMSVQNDPTLSTCASAYPAKSASQYGRTLRTAMDSSLAFIKAHIKFSFMALSIKGSRFTVKDPANPTAPGNKLKESAIYDLVCQYRLIPHNETGCDWGNVTYTQDIVSALSMRSGLQHMLQDYSQLRGFYVRDIEYDSVDASCGDAPYTQLRYLHRFLMEKLSDVTESF